MRVCVRCKVNQPTDQFYDRTRNGRHLIESRCKSCYRVINRENKRKRKILGDLAKKRAARPLKLLPPYREPVTGQACLEPGVDLEWFFPIQLRVDLFDGPPPTHREVERTNRQRVTLAKATCAKCPVRYTCLAENLDEPFGIFGGLTPNERRTLPGMAHLGHPVTSLIG